MTTEVTTISYTFSAGYVLTAEEIKADQIRKYRLKNPEGYMKQCEEKKRREEVRLVEMEKEWEKLWETRKYTLQK